ncbi:hypothetical protein AW119_27830 [Escherichia coli]|uniref:hypothetical protein n=1 Tax=Escherichia coli TaxID=562 RepID=UPI000335AFCB|nr:hypothetical protein [Escherichia coli]EOU64780.1 hypothetical protein WE5_00366 [Escherichia coli KTE19]OTD29082.1 hypothetical protein AW095_26830 [Escherichia coli]OTE44793.1 hypothetical protein AW119_27830 [Escherichia coli]HCQ9474837.1 hypothetical protein [Escherichia coli]HCT4266891.1 hypothetical protein [Escherichia coli]
MTEEKSLSLCRISWAQLSTAALDAEQRHDYARAKRLWESAFYITSLSINKKLAAAKYSYCAKCIGEKMVQISVIKKQLADDTPIKIPWGLIMPFCYISFKKCISGKTTDLTAEN